MAGSLHLALNVARRGQGRAAGGEAGRRISHLLRGPIDTHAAERFELAFNINVALLGAISEHNAVNKQREGPIKSRADARAALAAVALPRARDNARVTGLCLSGAMKAPGYLGPVCATCAGDGHHATGPCLDCDERGYLLPTSPAPLPF